MCSNGKCYKCYLLEKFEFESVDIRSRLDVVGIIHYCIYYNIDIEQIILCVEELQRSYNINALIILCFWN